ncbi:receptor-type tyrosine-protein phosphatase alpha-like [Physella acuta]|uniref:receptor-type tyrosine-protein phosphatase alpha-like n=1 Tax=Physella acuta TaxID=109671 RepID=UPI0027DCDBFA|nr:receptor-type tyrosine-protein phosphatase alpha-like [Physella acuta]
MLVGFVLPVYLGEREIFVTKNCSSNCEESKCNITTGECYTCVAGFKGTFCNVSCDSQHFGPNCIYNCSSNCDNSECNETNGYCNLCKAGYQGDFCNSTCDGNHYGPGCIYTCSQSCDNSECDKTDGCCNNCPVGYTGELCETTCDNAHYGAGCTSNCSHLCVRNETQAWCNKTDGQCLLGCLSGFKQEDTECSRFWAPQQSADKTDGNTLIPIVVPIVVVLVAVSLVVASVIYYRRRNAKGSKPLQLDAGNKVQTTTLDAKDGSIRSMQIELDQSVPQKPVAVVNAYCNGNVDKKYIEVSNLNEFMLAHGAEYFSNEFKLIPSPQNLSMSVGLSDLNRNKNRYKNICAYDHSRVHLEINTSKNEGDYINASYIEGYNNEEKFIASQGPTDATINDFVRMLWQQKVDKVVMLTNLIEEGKMKCVSYWPEEGTTTFGDIKVKLAATHVFADYTIRKLELIKKDHPTHHFTQFHFTSWPDKGVPLTPWGLVDFEQRVALEKTSKPILVHCSAGVGRTGTFIALRNVMREAEDTGRINCFQTVAKLRQDRVLMVQTAEQYEFLHKAAEVAIICIGTTVTSRDITSRISHLEESVGGRSNLDKEFKAILAVCSDFIKDDVNGSNVDETNVYQNNHPPEMAKNRVSAILPDKIYRAVLLIESANLSDYINAVLVSGFTKRENQILTQLPMPNTVTDFWRLVAQYNVKLVVAFQTEDFEKDKSLGQYLPADMTTPLDCGPYEIHTGPVKSESLWEEQQITVKVVKKALGFLPITNESHVTHIASKSTDLNPKNLLKLLKHTRSNNVQAQGRVLYMCRNGAEYSGLACVLSLLLDRMDHDQSLTVPLVVGAIKCIRPQVIPSLNQYRCLYQVLQRYNETSSPYNNHDQLSRPSYDAYVNIPLEINGEENVYANSQNATRI